MLAILVCAGKMCLCLMETKIMVTLNAESIERLNHEFNLTRVNLLALNKLIMEHFNSGDLFIEYYPAYGLCFNYYGVLSQVHVHNLDELFKMRYLDVLQAVTDKRVN